VSAAAVSRYLARAGLVVSEPKKRPKSSYIRFAAEQPNERRQSGFIHWRLAGGQQVEIVSWIDDHSRLALSITAHPVVTGAVTLATFRAAQPQLWQRLLVSRRRPSPPARPAYPVNELPGRVAEYKACHVIVSNACQNAALL
jgi:hypothetical protein